MLALFEIVIMAMAIIYVLKIGRGRNKLWAFGPIVVFIIWSIILSIIIGIIFGFDNTKALSNSPFYFAFAIAGAVVIIGSSFMIIKHVQKLENKRIEEEIDREIINENQIKAHNTRLNADSASERDRN